MNTISKFGMADLIDMTKKQFKLRFMEIIAIIVTSCIAFIMGMVLFAIIAKIDDTVNEAIFLGFMFAMLSAFMIVFFWGVVLVVRFNNAISMGRTRKVFALSYFVVSFVEVCMIVVLGFTFNMIENILGSVIYPDLIVTFNILDVLTPVNIVLIILVGTILPIFIGSIIVKYGKKAVWVLWAIWMIICLLPSRIVHAVSADGDSILGIIGGGIAKLACSVNLASWYIAACIVLIIMLISVMRILGKHGMTN